MKKLSYYSIFLLGLLLNQQSYSFTKSKYIKGAAGIIVTAAATNMLLNYLFDKKNKDYCSNFNAMQEINQNFEHINKLVISTGMPSKIEKAYKQKLDKQKTILQEKNTTVLRWLLHDTTADNIKKSEHAYADSIKKLLELENAAEKPQKNMILDHSTIITNMFTAYALGDTLGFSTEFNKERVAYENYQYFNDDYFKDKNQYIYTDDTAMLFDAIHALNKIKDDNSTEAKKYLALQFMLGLRSHDGWGASKRAPGICCTKNIEQLLKSCTPEKDQITKVNTLKIKFHTAYTKHFNTLDEIRANQYKIDSILSKNNSCTDTYNTIQDNAIIKSARQALLETYDKAYEKEKEAVTEVEKAFFEMINAMSQPEIENLLQPAKQNAAGTSGGSRAGMWAPAYAFLFHKDEKRALKWTKEHTDLTHNDTIAYAARTGIVSGLIKAIHQHSPLQIVNSMIAEAEKHDSGTAMIMREAKNKALDLLIINTEENDISKDPKKRVELYKEKSKELCKLWHGRDSKTEMAAIVYAFLLFPDDFKSIIDFTVNMDGRHARSTAGFDTDTLVSILLFPDDYKSIIDFTVNTAGSDTGTLASICGAFVVANKKYTSKMNIIKEIVDAGNEASLHKANATATKKAASENNNASGNNNINKATKNTCEGITNKLEFLTTYKMGILENIFLQIK